MTPFSVFALAMSIAPYAPEPSPAVCYELLLNQNCCLWGPDPKLIACTECAPPAGGTCCYTTAFFGGADPITDQLIPGDDFRKQDAVAAGRTCIYRIRNCPVPCSESDDMQRPCDHWTVIEDPEVCVP